MRGYHPGRSLITHERLNELQARLEMEAKGKLETFVPERLQGDGNYELCRATGAPATQIRYVAHAIRPDLLLLGVRVEGKAKHRLLGDAVARMLREAPLSSDPRAADVDGPAVPETAEDTTEAAEAAADAFLDFCVRRGITEEEKDLIWNAMAFICYEQVQQRQGPFNEAIKPPIMEGEE